MHYSKCTQVNGVGHFQVVQWNMKIWYGMMKKSQNQRRRKWPKYMKNFYENTPGRNSAKNATDASPRWIGFSRQITTFRVRREMYGSRIVRHLGISPWLQRTPQTPCGPRSHRYLRGPL